MLQLTDAVWATTRGVGRLWRAATAVGESSNLGVYWRDDEFDYVLMMDCDLDINADASPTATRGRSTCTPSTRTTEQLRVRRPRHGDAHAALPALDTAHWARARRTTEM